MDRTLREFTIENDRAMIAIFLKAILNGIGLEGLPCAFFSRACRGLATPRKSKLETVFPLPLATNQSILEVGVGIGCWSIRDCVEFRFNRERLFQLSCHGCLCHQPFEIGDIAQLNRFHRSLSVGLVARPESFKFLGFRRRWSLCFARRRSQQKDGASRRMEPARMSRVLFKAMWVSLWFLSWGLGKAIVLSPSCPS